MWHSLWVSWGIIAGAWLIRVVMLLVVVTRKKKPVACLAWLAVIYFMPWIGLALYLLIGENGLGRRRVKQHSRHAELLVKAVNTASFLQRHVIHPTLDDRQEILAHVTETLGGLPILGGNDVELLADTEQVVARLIADIDAARDHVHLLFYIFAGDDVGRRVGAALERASARGVRCRVLADAVGSRKMFRVRGWKPAGERIEVRPMLTANILRRRLARLDLRNHRKLAVIDGRIGYAGSQNIVRADYGHPRIGPWRDIMIRVQGPSVSHLQAVFLEDWDFTTGQDLEEPSLYPEPAATGRAALQAVPSGPNFPTTVLQDVVVEAVHAARRQVILTSPYFVPDDSLLVALRLAAMRGAQVDIVVPLRTNHVLTDTAGRFYFEQLLKDGVHVHRHRKGLLHAKTLTVDDQLAMIGSANFDVRSFYINFELNVLLYDAEFTAQLRMLQRQYMQESEALELDVWMQRSPGAKLGQNCAKLLSPLL